MTHTEAIKIIELLYPPDSGFPEVAAIGQQLMTYHVGNPIGFKNWRSLPLITLINLAQANQSFHESE